MSFFILRSKCITPSSLLCIFSSFIPFLIFRHLPHNFRSCGTPGCNRETSYSTEPMHTRGSSCCQYLSLAFSSLLRYLWRIGLWLNFSHITLTLRRMLSFSGWIQFRVARLRECEENMAYLREPWTEWAIQKEYTPSLSQPKRRREKNKRRNISMKRVSARA